MAVWVRSTKAPSGGTSWVTGDTITQAAFEGDMSGLATQVNGNLDSTNLANNAVTEAKLAANAVTNAKVAAAAAIAVSKLDQTAGQLDMDIVDDFSGTLAESKTATDPGTQDSASAATNAEEELARLRYVLKRLALGAGTLRTTGADTAAWFDGCAVGANVLTNGSFLDNSTTPAAPMGWALVGTPNAIVPTAMPVQEGVGRYVLITDAVGTGGAANEGIQQTLAGLKADTLYLVEARVRPVTDIVQLITMGAAAGTFTNLDLHSASGGGAWETLSGLIWTDNTPTNIVVQLLSNTTDYSFGVSYVSVREVVSPAAAATNEHEGTTTRGGQLLRTAASTVNGDVGANNAAFQTATTRAVVVPGPGYQILVHGHVNFSGTSDAVRLEIQEGGVAVEAAEFATSATEGHMSLHYAVESPTPGTIYTFRLSATATAGAPAFNSSGVRQHRMTVLLMRTD